jgi:hypothetical protein
MRLRVRAAPWGEAVVEAACSDARATDAGISTVVADGVPVIPPVDVSR